MTQSPATPPVCDAREIKCWYCHDTKVIRVDLPQFKWIPMKDGIYHKHGGDVHECVRGVSQVIRKPCPKCSAPPPAADEARMLAHNIAFRASELSREKLGPEARKASVMIENDLEPEECAYALAALLSRVPSEEAAEEEIAIAERAYSETLFGKRYVENAIFGLPGRLEAMAAALKAVRAITRAPGAGV